MCSHYFLHIPILRFSGNRETSEPDFTEGYAYLSERGNAADDFLKAATEQLIEKQKKNLAESAEGFYEVMENQQLDELLTGLALQYNLFPVSLNISQPVAGVPGAYQSGTTSSDTANTESNSFIQYLSTVTVSVTLQGTETQICELIDDVAKNYPGIQIRSLDMQKATYVNANLQAVEQMNCSCEFAVYMYQKEDTSEEGNGSEK